jgi:hypothetical protein
VVRKLINDLCDQDGPDPGAAAVALKEVLSAHPRYLRPLMYRMCFASVSLTRWDLLKEILMSGTGLEAIDAYIACLRNDPDCIPPESIGGNPARTAQEVRDLAAARLGELWRSANDRKAVWDVLRKAGIESEVLHKVSPNLGRGPKGRLP